MVKREPGSHGFNLFMKLFAQEGEGSPGYLFFVGVYDVTTHCSVSLLHVAMRILKETVKKIERFPDCQSFLCRFFF